MHSSELNWLPAPTPSSNRQNNFRGEEMEQVYRQQEKLRDRLCRTSIATLWSLFLSSLQLLRNNQNLSRAILREPAPRRHRAALRRFPVLTQRCPAIFRQAHHRQRGKLVKLRHPSPGPSRKLSRKNEKIKW